VLGEADVIGVGEGGEDVVEDLAVSELPPDEWQGKKRNRIKYILRRINDLPTISRRFPIKVANQQPLIEPPNSKSYQNDRIKHRHDCSVHQWHAY